MKMTRKTWIWIAVIMGLALLYWQRENVMRLLGMNGGATNPDGIAGAKPIVPPTDTSPEREITGIVGGPVREAPSAGA